MIVAHGIARQVAGIAKRHKVLLLYIIFALRLVANNVGDHKVIMIQRLSESILRVAQQALAILSRSRQSEQTFILFKIYLRNAAD